MVFFSFREDIIELEGRRVTRMVVTVTNNEKIYGTYTWGVDMLWGFDLSLMEVPQRCRFNAFAKASIREVEIHSSEFVDELLIFLLANLHWTGLVFNLNVEDPYCLYYLELVIAKS